MDVSDGLADDLAKLCKASGVSGKIFADQLPVHPFLSSRFPDDCVDLALGGGEDYVLLFTGQPAKINHVVSGLPEGAASGGRGLGRRTRPGHGGRWPRQRAPVPHPGLGSFRPRPKLDHGRQATYRVARIGFHSEPGPDHWRACFCRRRFPIDRAHWAGERPVSPRGLPWAWELKATCAVQPSC